MSAPLWLDAIGFWAPSLPGWAHAGAVLRGEALPADPPAKRPQPQLLAPAERRRAPDTVALALDVAAAACAAAEVDPAGLPSVFVSGQGDLGINDHMCATLASNPTMLSPTKFHNSVHNAAAGYWTMAVACHEASTALTAYEWSFANGWLAAAMQCLADQRPVLLVGYDVTAVGPLASVTRSDGLLAMALVLSPRPGPRSLCRFDWQLQAGPTLPISLTSPATQALAGNALSDALPLAEALARLQPAAAGAARSLTMPLSERLALQLTLST